jgi:Relaxase/Mobilisation nuclease domain
VIVKILSAGKSFKGLATYLTHDPKAKTQDRVAWTHTLNLANDHVPSAVDELIWTSRHAELLKQEAGIRAGGRATENAVKHLSLNWAPEDKPTKEHMIEATGDFLTHMKWQEHQAIIVAHEDKAHAHVHVMLNVVHPETGLRLNDDFERRRAQTWALEYERENGRIHCEQRLLNADERENSPTRPAWMAFQEKQRDFDRDEKALRKNGDNTRENNNSENIAEYSEWKKLKEIQKLERQTFFASGKSEFKELRNSIYREVKEEFRDRWSDYYEQRKDGGDVEALAAMKAELVAEQKALLEQRRDEACKELRLSRDGIYRDLLDGQRDNRAGLRARQEAGLDNTLFLERMQRGRDGGFSRDVAAEFREAAEVATSRRNVRERTEETATRETRPAGSRAGMKSGTDIGARMGETVGMGLISLFESVADGVMGATKEPDKRQPEPGPQESKPVASNDNVPKAVERSRQDDEDDWYRRQRSRAGE